MRRRQPGWLGVALAASFGGLAGVLATLALGGGATTHIETVTVPAAPDEDMSLVSRTAVPRLVGVPLDDARDRLRDAGFLVEVDGARPTDLVLGRGLTVIDQDPAGGTVLTTGSTVRVRVRPR